MRIPLDDRFEHERTAFRFVFTCEHCVHHDAVRERCAHGYPTHPHRAAAFAQDGRRDGMFCKEFEID